MRIELRIDRVVLEGVGVAPGDLLLLEKALVDELTALIQARGLAPPRTHLARLDAGGVDARPADPGRLGRELAGTLHAALGRPHQPARGGDAR